MISADEITTPWEHRVFGALERVKAKRGISLCQPLPVPRSKWDTPHCGHAGCPCTHGRRGRQRGDLCDRGLVPVSGDPDTPGPLIHCRTCRAHAKSRENVDGGL